LLKLPIISPNTAVFEVQTSHTEGFEIMTATPQEEILFAASPLKKMTTKEQA